MVVFCRPVCTPNLTSRWTLRDEPATVSMAPMLEVDTLAASCATRCWWSRSPGGSTPGWPAAGAVAVLSEQLESKRDVRPHRPRRPHGPPADPADRAPRRRRLPRDRVAVDRLQSPGAPGATSWCASGPSRRCAGGRCSARSSTLAQRLGVSRGVHRRRHPERGVAPPAGQVLATGTDEDSSPRSARGASDYTGPTGAQSVLQVLLGEAGIPTVALWAQVPHYVPAGRRRRRSARVLATAARPRRPRRSISRPRRPGAGLHPAGRGGPRRPPDVVEVIQAIEAGEAERRRAPERRRARVGDRAVPPRPVLSRPAAAGAVAGRRAGAGSARPAHQASRVNTRAQ